MTIVEKEYVETLLDSVSYKIKDHACLHYILFLILAAVGSLVFLEFSRFYVLT